MGKIQVNSLKDLTRVGSVLTKDYLEPSVFDLEDIQTFDNNNRVHHHHRRQRHRSSASASGVESDMESSNIPSDETNEEDEMESTTTTSRSCPKFDERSRNFELDNCNGYGKICLVYPSCQPGEMNSDASSAQIWFLDRSLTWYFLASSFTNYYRLLIAHLGLPQWPMLFTRDGLPPCLYVNLIIYIFEILSS